MAHVVDLECGRRPSASSAASDGDSICFSDADEGSCYSQFYSTYDDDGSYNSGSEQEISEEVVSIAGSDCSVDIECGSTRVDKAERDCRICQLSLVEEVGSGEDAGSGCGAVVIELGCSCKDDLGAAHRHCAETWFKIKGNKICEICNSIARNLVETNETAMTLEMVEMNAVATNTTSAPVSPNAEIRRGCLNGHRFLNFLLACMVFAFVISWLFHFNVPS